MSTASEVKKANKWDVREGYKSQPVHPLVAFWRAFWRVAKNMARPVYQAFKSFKYAYDRERGIAVEAKFTAPVGDPILDRMAGMGIEAEEIKKDEQKIVLWRTADGRYYSESMLKAGKLQDPSMLTAACHISDEEADDLIMQMEAMSLETDLTEDETTLLKELRRARDARFAY
jgi:hypothetical protein